MTSKPLKDRYANSQSSDKKSLDPYIILKNLKYNSILMNDLILHGLKAGFLIIQLLQ